MRFIMPVYPPCQKCQGKKRAASVRRRMGIYTPIGILRSGYAGSIATKSAGVKAYKHKKKPPASSSRWAYNSVPAASAKRFHNQYKSIQRKMSRHGESSWSSAREKGYGLSAAPTTTAFYTSIPDSSEKSNSKSSTDEKEPAGSLSPEVTGAPATLTGSAASIPHPPEMSTKRKRMLPFTPSATRPRGKKAFAP